MTSAARKVAINTLFGRDLFHLSHEEYVSIVETAGVGWVWLPPSAIIAIASLGKGWKGPPPPSRLRAIIGRAVGREVGATYKFNLISFRRLQHVPFAVRKTLAFIREVVVEGRACEQTSLFESINNGLRISRDINGENLVIDDVQKLKAYHDKVLALADSIRKSGLQAPAAGAPYISVAIDENGQFLHLSKGIHRLAIATEFGIARVPVRVRLIAGRYFLNFFDRRRAYSSRHVLGAIRLAVEHAELHATASIAAPDHRAAPAGGVTGQLFTRQA